MKLLMIAIILFAIGTQLLLFVTLLVVKIEGHVTIIEPNTAILITELSSVLLLIVLGFVGLAYELRTIKKGADFRPPHRKPRST
jgi:Sec-independent protein secretion pathway component TatC